MALLDSIDLAISDALQKDGRMSIVELAGRVNLTKTPCAERVRKLEEAGVIRGYRAVLSETALDVEHVTMVQVLLNGTTQSDLVSFNNAVKRVDEVQSCHMIAGDFDYLLKVRTRDIKHYRQVLGDVISRLPGVRQTHTYVVMETVKDEATISVPQAGRNRAA
jgi:Lrp/AsnC family leucine-responsive transcriptional regulator